MIKAPKFIEIEPTHGCNLRCRMCHVAFMRPHVEYLDLDRISSFSFLKNTTVVVGGVFEPSIHPQFNKLIDILNKNNCKVALITNGHNLHKKHFPALFDADLRQVTFSFDGITKVTYEKIRIGGDYANTLKNIEKFISMRSPENNTLININSVVLRCNLHEVSLGPSFWDDRGVDVLNYVAMTTRENDTFLVENSLWNFKEGYYNNLDLAAQYVVDNNCRITLRSPYFESGRGRERWGGGVKLGNFSSSNVDSRNLLDFNREYHYGDDFGVVVSCTSPFVSARIVWNGDVMLCHNQNIGSLYDHSFDELWCNSVADGIRNVVRTNDALCKSCDYYRLCVNSSFLDLDDKRNHFSKKFTPAILKKQAGT